MQWVRVGAKGCQVHHQPVENLHGHADAPNNYKHTWNSWIDLQSRQWARQNARWVIEKSMPSISRRYWAIIITSRRTSEAERHQDDIALFTFASLCLSPRLKKRSQGQQTQLDRAFFKWVSGFHCLLCGFCKRFSLGAEWHSPVAVNFRACYAFSKQRLLTCGNLLRYLFPYLWWQEGSFAAWVSTLFAMRRQ